MLQAFDQYKMWQPKTYSTTIQKIARRMFMILLLFFSNNVDAAVDVDVGVDVDLCR